MIFKYYVYQYLRRDGTPYYIGKGCGNRAWNPHRYGPPSDKDRIDIIACKLSNHEALLLEKKLIAFYGRKCNGTGTLRNFTDGGDFGGSSYGMLGKTHSEETKKNISDAKRGCKSSRLGTVMSDETKMKLSKSMKNKPWTEARRLAQLNRKKKQ